MSKGFDQVLKSAFVAGLEYDNGEEFPYSPQEIDEAFGEWRLRFAGLENAETEVVGAEPAMGDEQAEDQDGSKTVPRSTSEICPCSTPGHTHSIFVHTTKTTASRTYQGGSEAGCYS